MALPKVLVRDLQDDQQKEQRLARLEQMENEIFERASGVLNAALSFHEVDPRQAEPPEAWIAEYGLEGARQRLGIAKNAWLPPNLAANGTKLAAQFVIGSMRARGYRAGKTINNVLNAQIVLPAPTTRQTPGAHVYQTKVIE